jgi:hypothetical protein
MVTPFNIGLIDYVACKLESRMKKCLALTRNLNNVEELDVKMKRKLLRLMVSAERRIIDLNCVLNRLIFERAESAISLIVEACNEFENTDKSFDQPKDKVTEQLPLSRLNVPVSTLERNGCEKETSSSRSLRLLRDVESSVAMLKHHLLSVETDVFDKPGDAVRKLTESTLAPDILKEAKTFESTSDQRRTGNERWTTNMPLVPLQVSVLDTNVYHARNQILDDYATKTARVDTSYNENKEWLYGPDQEEHAENGSELVVSGIGIDQSNVNKVETVQIYSIFCLLIMN